MQAIFSWGSLVLIICTTQSACNSAAQVSKGRVIRPHTPQNSFTNPTWVFWANNSQSLFIPNQLFAGLLTLFLDLDAQQGLIPNLWRRVCKRCYLTIEIQQFPVFNLVSQLIYSSIHSTLKLSAIRYMCERILFVVPAAPIGENTFNVSKHDSLSHNTISSPTRLSSSKFLIMQKR